MVQNLPGGCKRLELFLCHFSDEGTEAQRDEGTCSRSHSWEVAGRGIVAMSVCLFQPYLMATQSESQTCPQSSPHGGHLVTELSGVQAEPLARWPSRLPSTQLSPGAQMAGPHLGRGQGKAMRGRCCASSHRPQCSYPRTPNNPLRREMPLKSLIFKSLSALLLAFGRAG